MLKDTVKSKNHFLHLYGLAVFIAVIIVISAFGPLASAQDSGPKKFKTPEDAFKALTEAAKINDTKELLSIFGHEGKEIISSGDPIADRLARERFVKAAGDAVKFSQLDNKTIVAIIGKDKCSFPIPIVKSGQKWIFSAEEGKQEIINRRIGRNELNTIQVALAYVEAQRRYASKPYNDDGVLQYAQHFVSHKDRKDGLFWETTEGEESSPLGPLFARATEEGYSIIKKGEKLHPYYGYYFKILKGQGSNALGGEMKYVTTGKMISGFGLVAYPAQYGVSGITTFIVNQLGILYQKDLGQKTEELAKAITKFDPDKTWKQVEQAPASQ